MFLPSGVCLYVLSDAGRVAASLGKSLGLVLFILSNVVYMGWDFKSKHMNSWTFFLTLVTYFMKLENFFDEAIVQPLKKTSGR